MAQTRLQEDLFQDFKEQKEILLRQIELFDPLATSLRRPAAQRLMSKGGLIVAEVFCYLAAIGSVVFAVAMNRLHPFGPLKNVRFIKDTTTVSTLTEEEYFSIAVHAMAGLIALLFYVMARIVRRIRLKNDVLDLAGRNIKELMGQHLQRKAAIDAIEQRHFLELPQYEDGIKVNNVNSIPNPGY